MRKFAFKYAMRIITCVLTCLVVSCGDSSKDEPNSNLPEETAKFVGLWTLTSSNIKIEDTNLMLLADGQCICNDKLGQWTFDKVSNILATTNASQYTITLSSNEAWAGIDLSNSTTITASKEDNESTYYFMKGQIVPSSYESRNKPNEQWSLGRLGSKKSNYYFRNEIASILEITSPSGTTYLVSEGYDSQKGIETYEVAYRADTKYFMYIYSYYYMPLGPKVYAELKNSNSKKCSLCFTSEDGASLGEYPLLILNQQQ